MKLYLFVFFSLSFSLSPFLLIFPSYAQWNRWLIHFVRLRRLSQIQNEFAYPIIPSSLLAESWRMLRILFSFNIHISAELSFSGALRQGVFAHWEWNVFLHRAKLITQKKSSSMISGVLPDRGFLRPHLFHLPQRYPGTDALQRFRKEHSALPLQFEKIK